MGSKIVCYGEVLWDVFPTHEKIGGAPLNVAIRLKSLKNEINIISKIGNDSKGENLVAFIEEKGVGIEGIQVDKHHKTGKVTVKLNQKGSASYDINFPRAWDNIEPTEEAIKMVESSDAFVYGSLVARNNTSKETLIELLNYASYKIFDVNLRPPYYTQELLIELMNKADFIKFNDDELFEISKYIGSKYNSIEQNIKYVAEQTNTKHICVTKGRHGAVLLYDDQLYYNSGYLIKVVDTVGAGDSFLATLINYLLKKENPQKAIDTACAVGALVAQSEGANPIISQSDIDNFVNPYL
ncbi:carbohydrate kinase family protein [Winogradskyella sp. MIT101101]|uniref:carbohydrate kinase family protein n=1 Tax=Winogradskyella sp. MIT101101 TaxID=3098297 RepID=UPI00399B13E2